LNHVRVFAPKSAGICESCMMAKGKKTLWGSAIVFFAGLALFVYVYFLPPYAGYSGGGMSGLPAAFMMIAAIGMMTIGTITGLGFLVFSLILTKLHFITL